MSKKFTAKQAKKAWEKMMTRKNTKNSLTIFLGATIIALALIAVTLDIKWPVMADSIVNTVEYQRAYQITKITPKDFLAIKKAGEETGIPYDVLMALYYTESSNGTNTGDQNPRDVILGEEWSIFEEICEKAGLDPDELLVNTHKAMGGFQFQPRTWQEITTDYADEHDLINPWDVQDAAYAAALYLDKNGYHKDPLTSLVIYKGGPGALKNEKAINQGELVLYHANRISIK